MSEEAKPSSPNTGRWQKGVSGNPKGRPSGRSYRAALDRNVARLSMEMGLNIEDKIATQHIQRCLQGDLAAIKEYADRTEGKVPTPIGGSDELGPIQAIVTGVVREGDE